MKNAVLVAVLALTGCGVQEAELNEGGDLQGEGGGELSATSRTYVTFKPDLLRKCAAPLCGGVFITDVNRVNPASRYVSGLDFSTSGLDDATIAKALDGSGDTVLRGKLSAEEPAFHTRKFIVSDAWRGMPGVSVKAGDSFFLVDQVSIQCIKAPCPTMKATRLNAGGSTMINKTDIAEASLPRVDQVWLTSRVELHDAIVAGRFTQGALISGTHEKVLTNSQVFVKLAEEVGPCPLAKYPPCATGMIRSYQRNVDRCELPSQCVKPGVCPQYVPACAEGYSLQSWSGGANACQVFACDPAFTL